MIEKDIDMLEQGNPDNDSMLILRAMRPWKDLRYGCSDLGNARLFADFFGDRARFMNQQNCWYVYDGRVWQQDPLGLHVRALAKALAVLLTHYVYGTADLYMQPSIAKQVSRWQSHKGRTEILRDAQDIYPLTPDMMDANPMYLNCLNGTLDLETGALHPHTASDFQSRLCGAEYHPKAVSLRWEQFVKEIMQTGSGQLSMADDEQCMQKVRWLQRMLGYALTGDTRMECLFMLYGASTRNGKGTLMETFLRLMGDYGASMQPESLGLRNGRNSGGPSEDIARLHGVRFVNVSEPDCRMKLSVSLVKTLTGNDTVTARYLHQNSFEYKPQFKLFINTNHLPEVNDVTLFQSGRVALLPFERHFEPHEQDRTLKQFLTGPWELSGILNWCFEGLRDLREARYHLGDAPQSAAKELKRYQADSDVLGQFVRDRLRSCEKGAVKASDVYEAYSDWCQKNGYDRIPSAPFRRSLESYYRLGRGRLNGGSTTNIVWGCELVA